jgi:hypothetical protein
MQGSQRAASGKVREALGDMQGSELRVRQKALADWYRRGYGSYVQNREPRVTQDLEKLAQQLREAKAAVGQGGKQEDNKLQQALSQMERIR